MANEQSTTGHAAEIKIAGKEALREPEIVVHTMPKRYRHMQPGANKAKGIGLVILVGGVVVLAVGLVFLYIYLSDSGQMQSSTAGTEPTAALTQTETAKQPATTGKGSAQGTGGTAGSASALAGNTVATTTKPAKTVTAQKNGQTATTTPSASAHPAVIATSTGNITFSASSSTTTAATATGSTKVINISQASNTPASYKSAVDSDGDGLTDLEEEVFDTNSHARDSDGDGYSDLQEVMNLYNPAGSGSIMVNPNIEKYTNPTYGYSLYYPKSWETEVMGGDDSVIFKIPNNQFIQIITQTNSDHETLQNWYKKQTGATEIKPEQTMYKAGWQGIASIDKLTDYLTKPGSDYIFVMTYNLGDTNILAYDNIFNMMVKSLEIGN